MGHTWDELAGLIGDLTNAAIDSSMHLLGYGGSTEEGFDGNMTRITPLGGKYVGSTFVPGGQASDPTGAYPTEVHFPPGYPYRTLPELIAYWNREIPALFELWWRCPMPKEMDATIASLEQATRLLSSDTSLSSDHPAETPFGANIDLAQMETIKIQIGRFDGLAMQAFATNYANRLPVVANSQAAVASFLWLAAGAEQAIWKQGLDDLAEVAAQGVAAMKQADGGGGDVSATLAVTSALASLASLIPFGTAATTVIKIVGTSLGAAAKFAPTAPKKPALGGDTPFAVVDNIRNALEDLATAIGDQERQLGQHLTGVADTISAQPASFDIARPPLLDDTDASHFRTSDDTAVHFGTLLTIARDTMPLVAKQFLSAGTQLDGATDSGPWTRPAGIGMGATGCFYHWDSLRATLAGLCENTGQELKDAGVHLERVADDFSETDAQIHAELDQHTKAIQASGR